MNPSEGLTPQQAAGILPDESPTLTGIPPRPDRTAEAESDALVEAPAAAAAELDKVVSSGNAPVSAEDRIRNMDVLRGFALLGILLMNILSWGLPEVASNNPKAAGGYTGINLVLWAVQMIFWDGKMRAIFSMMFGAGAYLLITRGEKRGGESALGIADIFYRRNLWMLLFGMIHGYLIWFGDILFPYAFLALILYPLRKLSPKALLWIAAMQIALLGFAMGGQGFGSRSSRDEAMKIYADQKAGRKITEEQQDKLKGWQKSEKNWMPPKEENDKYYKDYTTNYGTQMKRRAKEVFQFHAMPIYFPFLWDMLAFMLMGIAFVKMGVLQGDRSYKFYAGMAAAGYGIGIPMLSGFVWANIHWDFDIVVAQLWTATYEPGRMLMTLGHISVLIMICKAGALRWVTNRLAAVGQMAFSNYITHSVVCSLLFYGYAPYVGGRLMGTMERYQMYYVVAAIWIFQLIMSPIWLRHFRFGPLEWCWRSLTYWKKQPMRLRPVGVLAGEAVPAALE